MRRTFCKKPLSKHGVHREEKSTSKWALSTLTFVESLSTGAGAMNGVNAANSARSKIAFGRSRPLQSGLRAGSNGSNV